LVVHTPEPAHVPIHTDSHTAFASYHGHDERVEQRQENPTRRLRSQQEPVQQATRQAVSQADASSYQESGEAPAARKPELGARKEQWSMVDDTYSVHDNMSPRSHGGDGGDRSGDGGDRSGDGGIAQGPSLPPGWTAHLDPQTNRVYYFDAVNGESTWILPEPSLVGVTFASTATTTTTTTNIATTTTTTTTITTATITTNTIAASPSVSDELCAHLIAFSLELLVPELAQMGVHTLHHLQQREVLILRPFFLFPIVPLCF
jgi:hypothetical protein